MLRQKSFRMFFYSYCFYDGIISNYRFPKLFNKAINFFIINELCLDIFILVFYVPAYELKTMFKIIFRQFFRYVSNHRIEKEVNFKPVFNSLTGIATDKLYI